MTNDEGSFQPLLSLSASAEELRRYPARRLVSLLFYDRRMAHLEVRKDEKTRTLVVEVWWHEERISTSEKEGVVAAIGRLMNRWVWDGWRAVARSSLRDRPRFVWDPYENRVVRRR